MFFGPTILPFLDATANRVSIQTVIKLPDLNPREEMAVRAVSDLLMEATAEYSKPQILKWGSMAGIKPTVELMPGFVRISISTPPNQVNVGVSLTESLLRRPLFSESALGEWKTGHQASSSDYWQTALWPKQPNVRDLRKSDLFDAFNRYFRPENVTIAIGGNFPSDAISKAEVKFADWNMPRVAPVPLDMNRWKNTLSNSTSISTIEIACPEIRIANADFPTQLLACFALGVGKGATLFQIPRESMAQSYRQELLLWPTANGFVPRLILAIAGPEFTPEKAGEIRKAMFDSVSSWQEVARSRSLGVVDGLFNYGLGVSPFALTGQTTLGDSLEADTLMRAFWYSRSGKEWSPAQCYQSMKPVQLASLKEAASTLLEKAEVRVILGLSGR